MAEKKNFQGWSVGGSVGGSLGGSLGRLSIVSQSRVDHPSVVLRSSVGHLLPVVRSFVASRSVVF